MKIIILSLLFFSQVFCHLRYLNSIDYDVCSIETDQFQLSFNDLDSDVDYEQVIGKQTFVWNFCENIDTPCGGKDTMAAIFTDNYTKCTPLAPPSGQGFANFTVNQQKVHINYATDIKCQGNQVYSVNFDIHCNQHVTYQFQSIQNPTSCSPTIVFTSNDGCLTLVNPWLKYTPLLILAFVGLFLAFYGNKGFFSMRPVTCVCMVLPVFMFSFSAFFVSYTGRSYVLWGGLVIGVLVGMALSYMFKNRIDLGIKILSACIGFVIGLYVWQEAISPTANWKTLAFAFSFAVISVVIGVVLMKYVIIIMSSVFGGFIVANCLLEYDHSYEYFVYIALGGATTLFGFITQLSSQKKESLYSQFD